MLQLRKVKILSILFIFSAFQAVLAQGPMGRVSVGLTGSAECFIRTIVDAERFNIDSTFLLGITDQEYVDIRDKIDKPYFPGKSFGVLLAYKLNTVLTLESGLRYVEGGTRFEMSEIPNYNLITNFGIQNLGDKVVNKSRIIEVPLIMRHRLGSANRIDLGKRKTGSSLTNMYRHFFLSYGVGIGFPVNDRNFYNGVELNNITGNMGVAALGGIGFHMNTRSPFFFNIRAHARATLLSYYEYAPIKSYYHSVGAEFKIGYRFPYSIKEEDNGKPTDCASFKDSPDSKERPKFMFGMRYGAQFNFLMGASANDPLIGFQGVLPATEFQLETATGETHSTLTPHLGLHFEYLFHDYFSLGVSPIYTERGFKSKHTYFLKDGRTIKTRQRVYIGNFDVPLKIIFYPQPKYFLHTGPIISINMSNRLFDYYQVYDGLVNFPEENINYKEKVKVDDYFGHSPDRFSLGWEIGAGAHVDNALSVLAQLGFYESIFQKGNGRPGFWNTTIQLSMYYYFLRK